MAEVMAAKSLESMVETQELTQTMPNLKSPAKGQNPNFRVIQQILQVFLNAYVAFGFDASGWKMASTQEHWLRCVDELQGDWLKFAKYKYAAFFAYHLDQELPKRPPGLGKDSPQVLLGGRASRWTRIVLASSARLQFLQTIGNGVKKGCPRPSRERLVRAEQEAVEKLTVVHRGQPSMTLSDPLPPKWADTLDAADNVKAEYKRPVPVWDIGQQRLRAEIRRTVVELYSRSRYEDEDRFRMLFPSTSANYVRSRNEAGSVGAILAHPGLLDNLRAPFNTLVQFHRVASVEKDEEKKQPEQLPGQYVADTSRLREVFDEYYVRLLHAASDERPLVEPLALPESLKVRVISKGPPLTYAVLQPLQKFLHRVLRNHPAFSLVGETISAGYLESRLGTLEGEVGVGYLSGDYSDATNELASWASEEAAEALADVCHLRHRERVLLTRALTQHEFLTPSTGRTRKQRWGQLMGSVVSFPVLCIVNAALTRYAMELGSTSRMPIGLRDGRFCFNGDDIAAVMTARQRYAWRLVTRAGGLSESIGKTFYSRDFVQMNSTTFFPQGRELLQVPYVNFGLLMGYKRSGGKVGLADVADVDSAASLGARARELVGLAPPRLHGTLMKWFVRHHFDVLSTLHIPWYVHESLGGVGLPSWHDPETLTYHGATKLDAMKLYGMKARGVPRPPRLSLSPLWDVHKLIGERLPERQSVLTDEVDITDYDTVYGKMAVGLLFDEKVSIAELKPANKSYLRNLRRLERMWSVAKPLSKGLDIQRALAPVAGRAMGVRVIAFD